MINDKFGNFIYEEKDILELTYQEKTILIEQVYCDPSIKIDGLKLKTIDENIYDLAVKEFDTLCQNEWLMPEEYKNLDIKTYLLNKIDPWDYRYLRLTEELEEFDNRNMLDLLRWLKYLIDTARSNHIVWGVGRGSSVASYALYLLGVHKIDPIKYNLDYKDFLR